MRTLLLLLLGLAAAATAEYKSYSGYKVFEIYPKDEGQIRKIHDLSNEIDLDFWTESASLGRPIRIKVPPHKIGWMHITLELIGADYSIMIEDVGVNVETERRRLENKKEFDINDFNNYADIVAQLSVWQANCPASFTCDIVDLGLTYDGQTIWRFTISQGTGRRAYWIDSAIHAREWLAPATNLKYIDHFINNYGRDDDVTRLLDTYDWHFVPIMNPDGYAFSWTDDRYWRKSRNNNAGSLCMGTDLNRNYDAEWMVSGSSNISCSDIYAGETPASAVETQIIQNELRRLTPTLDAAVSIHTAAELVLHPYGHEEGALCAVAPTHAELNDVAEAMSDAIFAVSGIRWPYGNSCNTIYGASGLTMDFGYNKGAGIRFVFTPELRGPDFVIDPSYIPVSFDETWPAIVAMENTISPP